MLDNVTDGPVVLIVLLFAWPVVLIWVHAIVKTISDGDLSQLGAGFVAGWVKGLIASSLFWLGAAVVLWLVDSMFPEAVRTAALFVIGVPYLAVSIFAVWSTEPDF